MQPIMLSRHTNNPPLSQRSRHPVPHKGPGIGGKNKIMKRYSVVFMPLECAKDKQKFHQLHRAENKKDAIEKGEKWLATSELKGQYYVKTAFATNL